jgi:hypothetical protein
MLFKAFLTWCISLYLIGLYGFYEIINDWEVRRWTILSIWVLIGITLGIVAIWTAI